MTTKLPVTGWPFPTVPRCRIAVRRRVPHGMLDIISIAAGQTWSWWCSCDHDPRHTTSQSMALHLGLSHLADEHGERPTRRRWRR